MTYTRQAVQRQDAVRAGAPCMPPASLRHPMSNVHCGHCGHCGMCIVHCGHLPFPRQPTLFASHTTNQGTWFNFSPRSLKAPVWLPAFTLSPIPIPVSTHPHSLLQRLLSRPLERRIPSPRRQHLLRCCPQHNGVVLRLQQQRGVWVLQQVSGLEAVGQQVAQRVGAAAEGDADGLLQGGFGGQRGCIRIQCGMLDGNPIQ